eukprot:3875659-Rhodomonas_salina.2
MPAQSSLDGSTGSNSAAAWSQEGSVFSHDSRTVWVYVGRFRGETALAQRNRMDAPPPLAHVAFQLHATSGREPRGVYVPCAVRAPCGSELSQTGTAK